MSNLTLQVPCPFCEGFGFQILTRLFQNHALDDAECFGCDGTGHNHHPAVTTALAWHSGNGLTLRSL